MQYPEKLSDLLTAPTLAALGHAEIMPGVRHPAWSPLFSATPTPIDHLTNQAVRRVAREAGGKSWLAALSPRLIDELDPEEAAAAMAELRAYGALLEVGLTVRPIPTASTATADFEVDAGDGTFVVEVFAKHEDADQKQLRRDIARGGTPAGVHRSTRTRGGATVTTTIAILQPGGAPDPQKPDDCVTANVISRVCAAKGAESQFPVGRPGLLWIDFASFGGWSDVIKLEQTTALMSGHQGLTSGALWYAFYGWRDAPIFEEDQPLLERRYRMGHDGRYRLQGKKQSRLSGTIIALNGALTLFENPWAPVPLPDTARRLCERLPWFDIGHAIANWVPGMAAQQVDIDRRLIEAMDAWHADFTA